MPKNDSEALEEAVERFYADAPDASPGFALAVSVAGEIAWSHAVGLANLELGVPIKPTSVFHVASVSKQFTAVTIGMLIQDGLLLLEDDVRDYVPELANYGEPIRIRHLIHHTSGLRDDLWGQDFAGWRDDTWVSSGDALDLIFRQQGLSFPTGTTFFYSNAGYSLLALIVERVSGIPFHQFASERIFNQLDMVSTRFSGRVGEVIPNRAQGYSLTPEGELRTLSPEVGMNGAIGLYSTVEDFSHWFAYLDHEISKDSVIGQLLLRNGALDDGAEVDYSLGFFTGNHHGQSIIRHGGSHGGYRSHMLYIPEARLGITCFSNWGEFNPGAVCDTVADVVLGHTNVPQVEEPDAPKGHLFDLPAGVWFEVEWGAWLVIRESKDGLQLMDISPRPLIQGDSGGYSASKPGIGAQLFAANAQDASTLNVYVGSSDEPDIFRRVDVPTEADLSRFHGEYWSDELGALYRISIGPDANTLLLTRRGHDPATLYSVGSDVFAHGFFVNQISLAFARSESGDVCGFALSSLRTRNIQFRRASGFH